MSKLPYFLFDILQGPVAEWLGSALQKLLQRFESARDLGGKYLVIVLNIFPFSL